MSLDTRPRALSIPSSAISFNHIICYRAQQIGLDPINVQMVFGLLNQHPCLLTRAFSAQQRYDCFVPRVRILMQRLAREIGRASSREGVCQSVYISVVAVALKKKNMTR